MPNVLTLLYITVLSAGACQKLTAVWEKDPGEIWDLPETEDNKVKFPL